MGLPNLVGCGAGKSGTTSLFYYLNQHPQISMASIKETHYFSRHLNKGVEWYENQFRATEATKIVGEFSTSYMLDLEAPSRISKVVPDAKLLFIFRNPITRAYSNYWFSLSIGSQQHSRAFSDLIRSERGQKEYIEPGFYYQHLIRFLDYFNRDQIYIMITEELSKSPLTIMASCYQFLGVDDSFIPDIKHKFNVTVTSGDRWKVGLDQTWLSLKNFIKPLLTWIPGECRYRFSRIEHNVRSQLLVSERPPLAEEDRKYLKELYHEHNQNLSSFLDRELPWN